MRQVLILALCVIAALAATPVKNCSSVMEPSSTSNYYMPPAACAKNDTGINACMTAFSDCLKLGSDCGAVNTCYSGRIACLIGTTPSDSACNNWATGLNNAVLYLMAGGTYKDSTLERACEYGLCAGAKEALAAGIKTPSGDVCTVDFATVCAAPNFEPPTQSPTQAKYAVTFGGAQWTEVLKNAPKGSVAYKNLEVAVGKGLARLLGVLEHLITILSISIASLKVEFIVNDPTVSVAAVTAKLEEVKANPSLAASTFEELATESGVTIEVTGVATEVPVTPSPDGTTPAPNGTTPAPASAGLVSVAVAVVAVIAMMF